MASDFLLWQFGYQPDGDPADDPEIAKTVETFQHSRSVTEARDLTAKLSNDYRDENPEGPVGFDSRAQRKREFAADMGLQAHVLRNAATAQMAAFEQDDGGASAPLSFRLMRSGCKGAGFVVCACHVHAVGPGSHPLKPRMSPTSAP